jgi:hypothetical protein
MELDILLGKDTVAALLNASLEKVAILEDAEFVMQFCNRDRALVPFIRVNVLISMIKSACLSHKLHPSKLSGAAERLIKSLGLDEPTRVMLYEALFDKEIIYKAGSVIYRN